MRNFAHSFGCVLKNHTFSEKLIGNKLYYRSFFAIIKGEITWEEDGILEDFLLKHRAAVVGMLFEEFDMKEYLKIKRQNSFTEGKAESLL